MKALMTILAITTVLAAACDAEQAPTFDRDADELVDDGDDAPTRLSIVTTFDEFVDGELWLGADRASGTLRTEEGDFAVELDSSPSRDNPNVGASDLQATLDPQELPPEDHGTCTICDASCKETSAGWVCKTWNCRHIAC